MKKLGLILIFLSALVSFAEDPAYTDIHAENFVTSRGITDRTEITRVHAWYKGLKGLDLWSDLVHACSYRYRHNSASGSTMSCMVGANGTINGTLQFTDNGVTYDGNNANYISFTNPLPNPATDYTILVVLDQVKPTASTYYALFSSFNGTTTRGPSLFVHGSPQQGINKGFMYHYNSSDGTASPGDILSADGYVASRDYSTPEFIACGYNSTVRKIYWGLGNVAESTGALGSVWNGNATFRLGQTLAGGVPLTGNVAFTAVWDRMLTTAELNAVRRLYAKTLGYGYIQKVQFVFEGDSLTAGECNNVGNPDCSTPVATCVEPYPLVLQRDSAWGNNVIYKNVATSGHTSSQMVTDLPSQLYPVNIDFDVATRQYYSIYGGINDGYPTQAQDVFNNLKSCWDRARAAGYRVIAYTFPDIQSSAANGLTASDRRAHYQALSRLIRQASGSYDYLIELDKIPELQNQNDARYYKCDLVHYTQAAHDLIAAAIKAKIPNP